MEELMKRLTAPEHLMLAIIVTIAAFCFDGFALATMWQWFIVPMLGLPTISIASAIGVGIMLGFVRGHRLSDGEGKALTFSLLRPWVMLLIAWLVRFFV